MAQSLVKNYIHIVFSTKHRKKLIDPSIENPLFKYLGGIANNLDCTPIKIGGHQDHVHILCLLSKKMTMVNLIEKLKSNSSKWIKTQGEAYQTFYWQNGYGAFSINPSEVEVVIDYISKQAEHHKHRTFQDEYLAFLKKYKIEYDEKFLWD